MTWPTVALEELTEPERSITYGVVKPGNHDDEDGVLFVRGGDIRDGRIAVEDLRTISKHISERYRRTLLHGGELLVSLVGNPGAVAMVPTSLGGANIARQTGLVALRDGVNHKFVEFFLRSPQGQAAMGLYVKGAVQQVINLGDLKRVDIPIPPLPTQQRIASTLSAYDDLIENNTRRIAILEEMTRRLYEKWFVDFRFPGYKKVEFDGELPTGWRRAEIQETYLGLFDGPHATPAPSSFGPIFLGIKNINEGGGLDLSTVRHIAEADYPRWTKRVVPEQGDIVFTYEATLNRYALLPHGLRCCLGRRMALIRPKPKFKHFLYLHFFSDDWRQVVAARTLSGATVDRIPLTAFPTFPITLPPEAVVATFDNLTGPIFDLVERLRKKNANLRTQRDLLLPKLVSGDIDVSRAETDLEAAE